MVGLCEARVQGWAPSYTGLGIILGLAESWAQVLMT